MRTPSSGRVSIGGGRSDDPDAFGAKPNFSKNPSGKEARRNISQLLVRVFWKACMAFGWIKALLSRNARSRAIKICPFFPLSASIKSSPSQNFSHSGFKGKRGGSICRKCGVMVVTFIPLFFSFFSPPFFLVSLTSSASVLGNGVRYVISTADAAADAGAILLSFSSLVEFATLQLISAFGKRKGSKKRVGSLLLRFMYTRLEAMVKGRGRKI